MIGPNTVNTVPPATLDAFRDHGKTRDSLEENVDAAARVLQELFGDSNFHLNQLAQSRGY